jgi:hypothetical protein
MTFLRALLGLTTLDKIKTNIKNILKEMLQIPKCPGRTSPKTETHVQGRAEEIRVRWREQIHLQRQEQVQ